MASANIVQHPGNKPIKSATLAADMLAGDDPRSWNTAA
jgi:hypothetical protein